MHPNKVTLENCKKNFREMPFEQLVNIAALSFYTLYILIRCKSNLKRYCDEDGNITYNIARQLAEQEQTVK